ncbi:hypothetical protein EJ02DRAFT_143491 [Clathrospora elynae]|uniref:Uncharacterized protein n=1 Tax=Clathrospora elynae TaxID=706981 RepID=A0A6A5S6U7_9PLEO|nr:hypothetical protein EJ02DRAFT_143491 [Clathrospora elynae]
MVVTAKDGQCGAEGPGEFHIRSSKRSGRSINGSSAALFYQLIIASHYIANSATLSQLHQYFTNPPDATMAITVQFDPNNMYSGDPARRTRIENEVRNFRRIPAAATFVVIRNGPHTSRSDRRVHITVDFYDNTNRHLTRLHVPSAY